MDNINFEGSKKEINSPRSLQACDELGILPEELFSENMDEFLNKNPDMINLPKDILRTRLNNIDRYRQKLIKAAKDKRKQIIENNKRNKSDNRKIDSHFSFDLEKEYIEMADKEKKTIEKLKQRQKNQIEAEIEVKMKTELLKYKSDMKESIIKEINDKIKEERKLKAIMEDKKIKEKELIREKTFKKRLEEQEKKNIDKNNAEKKRLKDMQEMQEKIQNEQIFRRTQKLKLIEKRKEAMLKQLKDDEIKNKEKEEANIRKEKKRQELIEKQRIERIKYNEIKKEENEKRLTKNKLNKELDIAKIKENIDKKEKITMERLNGIMEQKHRTIEEQKEKHQKRIEYMKNSLKKSKEDIMKRNKKIMQHQEHISDLVAQIEINKKNRLIERAKSQNDLFLKTVEKRDFNFQKMQEKFEQINKKMEKKEKKLSKEKKAKIQNINNRQEDEFIKQYEKQHTIVRLNRITNYNNRKRAKEISEKEKKIEKYKIKKQELIDNKAKLADSIEKEKQQLIQKFENIMQKNKQIDAEVVKKLFPEDEKLYLKIKNLQEDMYKKYNSELSRINNSNILNDILSPNIKDDELFFITQKNKKNEKEMKNKNIEKKTEQEN